MKIIPIVALVSEDVVAEIDRLAASFEPSPELRSIMDRNGWTAEALIAGKTLIMALMEDQT